ncbi:MAG: ASKHA domain-containing protein [Planctomycetes bacterium]|nr:ASKHA domain-containing protein [Planctomycetota bacterium]
MPRPCQLIVTTAQGRRVIHLDGQDCGRRLTELLRRAELPLNTRCGQRGLCDGCLIELTAGRLIREGAEQAVDASDGPRMLRACEYCVALEGDVSLHVPARSLLAHRPQVVTSFRVDVSRAHDPLWQTVVLTRDELAVSGDTTAEICRAIHRRRDGDLPVLAEGGLAFPPAENQQTFQVALDQQGDHWRVVPVEAGTRANRYGVAIDVGTTTVVVLLVDLADGRILKTASALNGQTKLGDNVLTRINLCLQNPQMVGRLQHAVVRGTIRPLLAEMLAESGIAVDRVGCLVIAGNTTMLHLVAGVDPSSLGTAPFTPQFLDHRVLAGRSLAVMPKPHGQPGVDAAPPSTGRTERADPTVHLLPGAAAYVGADVIAGVFSTGMAYRDESCLLVDVGTNGEIVLKQGSRFLACATAAGPAFEGAGLTNGVRAGHGAISHIRLDEDTMEPQIEVIGDGPPIGLCGTAYVDFIAEARRCALVGPTGRFTDRFADHPRRTERSSCRGFRIVELPDDKAIEITERDIATLLQAKAAIAAGVVCLLRRAGLSPREVATLYLAGGFGFHMNIGNVIRCGLLPGFRLDQIELVGNSSLAGAFLAMLDSGVLAEMKHIAERMETVELNLEPDFESIYIDQLGLPDDHNGCPTMPNGGLS